MRALLIAFLFFGLPFAAAAEEDLLPDFSNWRDPFLPLLPKVIIKTPVALTRQSTDNKKEAAVPVLAGPVVVTKKPPALRVQGIIWATGLPQAIVNNTVVSAGDEVSGIKVDSIRKDGVVVLFEGEKIHVRMEE